MFFFNMHMDLILFLIIGYIAGRAHGWIRRKR